MYRIDDATAATSLPAPEAAAAEGFFTEGNAVAGTPATKVRGSWLNMIQEELRAIPVAAGLTPSKTTYNQILTALKSMFSSAVGTVRNARMFVQTASASGTYTADEVIVETALGGQTYRIASINKTINLATTGAGGMDTGTAPVNGFVGLYLIYNPTTQVSALLATNAATLLGNVYGGANMPTGYTASALIGVMATNGSSQFKPFLLRDRKVNIGQSQAISTATPSGAPVALSVSSIVPLNAISVCGGIGLNSTVTSNMSGTVSDEAVSGIGTQGVSGAGTGVSGNYEVDLTVAQFIYYTFSSSAGTPTFVITVVAYRF